MSHSPPAATPEGRRRASLFVAQAALLGPTESASLNVFEAVAHQRTLRSGEILFRQGDIGDALYIVSHGSLEVLGESSSGGPPRSLGLVGRGGLVGEMALLVDEPRSATVRAVRDSEVLRVDKASFDAILDEHPTVAIDIARALVRRLHHTSSGVPEPRRPHVITLLSAREAFHPSVVRFAHELATALRGVGAALVVTSETVDQALGAGASSTAPGAANDSRLVEWLSGLEETNRFVLLCGDAATSAWTRRCTGQADHVLVVACADDDRVKAYATAEHTVAERALIPTGTSPARRELVLLHDDGIEWPSGTLAWLGVSGIAMVHHVREGLDDDVKRVARSIAGTSVGLVLSGGGARGFAHIGVVRAIRECGLPIDAIGGSSMGAIIGALFATGHDASEMTELCRAHYGRGGRDRTVPIVAFTSGRQSVRTLHSMFGDRLAEDLWIRYFAVSASLTQARRRVHDTGAVWLLARISSAIPGLSPPIVMDAELLADGAILDNLPVPAMRERCSGSVIASDVSVPVDLRPQPGVATQGAVSGWSQLWERVSPLSSGPPSLPSILEIMERTATLASVRDSQAAGRLADLHLCPPVDAFGMTSFDALDRLVDIGYRHAMERIEQWEMASRLRTNVGDA